MASGPITPNFSSDSSGRHTDYIEQLSRKYATLSKLKEEHHHETDDDRILALRGRIQETWARAEGNPASGKWVRVTRLLRMGVTSGRGGKWVGARADVKSPEFLENSSGWLNTMSESDWKEWEQKFVQNQNLKNRVETWKKGLELTIHPKISSTKHQDSHPATKDLEILACRFADGDWRCFGRAKHEICAHCIYWSPQGLCSLWLWSRQMQQSDQRCERQTSSFW